MEERTYLKWYNKIGYGSGDIAGNVVYAFLSSFVMLYLTNSIGLNAGIVGSLIAVSKLFDGVTDVFFGAMIDKTHSKMGKARPWMFYGYFGCALTLIGIFAIPVNLGETAQYAWFFITYTLLNAVFYTANNIAYSALTSLVTKNSKERVQMGSFRFMFAFATSLLIQSITLQVVSWLGGGANGWRTIAIIYAVIGLVINSLSVFSVKELPEEELAEEDAKAGSTATGEKKYGLVEAMKLLVANKYYLMICGAYILQQIYTAMLNMGVYFMTYVLLNENLYGVFSWFINIPLIVALVFTQLHDCHHRACAGNFGGLPGQRAADAFIYRGGGVRAGAVAGRHERGHCLLLGVHVAYEAQAGGRDDVFLHVAGNQAGRRHRDGGGRVASGGQRVRRQGGRAGAVHD